jgi:hypothetical protein
MKKAILTLVGAASLAATGAQASDCGCWELGAEALYWKTCSPAFTYATIRSETEGRLENVKPGSEWGFRLFGTYHDDCRFITLDWTYFKPSDASFIGPNSFYQISPVAVNLPEAVWNDSIGRIRLHYTKVNLRIGYHLHQSCCLDFYSYIGGRYVDIKQKKGSESNRFPSGTYNILERTDFDGLGLEAGVGADYAIACGFNLATHFGPVVLLGHQRLRYEVESDFAQNTILRYPTYTHCVPGAEFRIGLNYAYDCRCGSIIGEIGYHVDYYFDILASQNISASGGSGFSRCVNVGFAGPYASLSVCF